jgi:hypothetical protein
VEEMNKGGLGWWEAQGRLGVVKMNKGEFFARWGNPLDERGFFVLQYKEKRNFYLILEQ